MLENKDKNSFLKGTISLSLAVIVTKILGVMYKIPLSYMLGDEGMGYFNSAYAIYGFVYILCTAGVPKAMALTLSEYKKHDPNISDGRILRCALGVFAKIGIFATLLSILSAPHIVNLIGSKNSLYSIIAITPSIVFVSISGALRGYHNSSGSLTCIAVSQFVEAMIKLVCGLLMAYIGIKAKLSLPMISALSVTGITLGSIISCCYLYAQAHSAIKVNKTRQKITFKRREVNRRLLKIALPISVGSSVLNLAGVLDLAFMMNRLLASGLTEVDATVIYGNYTTLAVPMFNLVISIITPLTMAYLPKLSNAYYLEDKNLFKSETNKMLMIVNLISIPATLMFGFYSFDLLDVLFSVNSAALGADMLTALSLGVCLLSMLTVVNTMLEAQGKIKITLLSLFVGAIVKMTCTYFLMNNPSLGVLGAPIGTVLSYFSSLLISLLALNSSGFKSDVAKRTLVMLLAGVVSFSPVYYFLYLRGIIGNPLIFLFACGAVSMIIYLILLFAFYILCFRESLFNVHKNEDLSLSVRTNL